MKLYRATQLLGLMLIVFLTACGGGGSGSSSGNPAPQHVTLNVQPASEFIQITGAGIKGPLAFADARVYAVDTALPDFYDKNSPLAEAISDQFAGINDLSVPRNILPPYILLIDGSDAIDLNTGIKPVISKFVTVITADMLNDNRPVYATPLTTLAYHMARYNSEPSVNSETFVQEVNNASSLVSDLFAIDQDTKIDITGSPLIINDATITLAEQQEAVYHRAAVEAFAAKVSALARGKGDGLHATYFNDANLSSIALERIDPEINFQWEGRRPATSVNLDQFSVRWTGLLQADFSENYTFYTSTDDGVRLWIDGQLVIDQWHDQPETEFQGNIALIGGQKYSIVMEYYDNTGGAAARLLWSSNSIAKSIVPQTNLYSTSDAALLLDFGTDAIIEQIAIDLQSDGVIDNMASGSVLGGIDPAIINQNPLTLTIPNTSYAVQDIAELMEEERVLIGTNRSPVFYKDDISLTTAPQTPTEGNNTSPPVVGNTPPVEDNTPPVEDNTPPVEDNTPPIEDNTPPVEDTPPPVVDNGSAGDYLLYADFENRSIGAYAESAIRSDFQVNMNGYNESNWLVQYMEIVADPASSGRDNVLRVKRFARQGWAGPGQGGMQFRGDFTRVEDVYFAFDMYLAPGHEYMKQMKNPGLMFSTYDDVGHPDFNTYPTPDSLKTFVYTVSSDGNSAWGRGDGALNTYFYDKDVVSGNEFWDRSSPTFSVGSNTSTGGNQYQQPTGRWITVELRMKMNTVTQEGRSGLNDGLAEVWVTDSGLNGGAVTKVSSHNHKWRINSSIGIDGISMSNFYGGDGGDPDNQPSRDQYHYYDNFRVSTSPITH